MQYTYDHISIGNEYSSATCKPLWLWIIAQYIYGNELNVMDTACNYLQVAMELLNWSVALSGDANLQQYNQCTVLLYCIC